MLTETLFLCGRTRELPACHACMFTSSMDQSRHILGKPHEWWLQNLRRAFQYNWRLWTIPELREMLVAAGFSQTYVWLRSMKVHRQLMQNGSTARVLPDTHQTHKQMTAAV